MSRCRERPEWGVRQGACPMGDGRRGESESNLLGRLARLQRRRARSPARVFGSQLDQLVLLTGYRPTVRGREVRLVVRRQLAEFLYSGQP
jgi:hypothetical protein